MAEAAFLRDSGSATQYQRSVTSLVHWILSVAGTRTCYSCLYRPASAYLTEIRDTYHDQYDAIVTDSPDLYEEARLFLEQQCPGELHKLKLYQDRSR